LEPDDGLIEPGTSLGDREPLVKPGPGRRRWLGLATPAQVLAATLRRPLGGRRKEAANGATPTPGPWAAAAVVGYP
jgi:hypothetical protein